MFLVLLVCAGLWLGEASDRDDLQRELETVADGERQFQKGSKLGGILAREQARLSMRLTTECKDTFTYRPLDGVCNNLKNQGWGAPLQEMRRILDPEYDDDHAKPRAYGKDENLLPSARKVSTECFPFDSKYTEDKPFSQMVMQWGQFLDHDITGTPGTGGSDCCADMDGDGLHPDYETNGPCFPIQIPAGDRKFVNCMGFSRSLPARPTAEDCRREQLNVLTSYIDASNVYGSSIEESSNLRTGAGGLLVTSEGNMLPISDKTFCVKRGGHSCYNAGDFRVNVFPGLTAMHTLWVREHNRLAAGLARVNRRWSDDKLFQEARKIVIASMQHITYDNWLRKVLGPLIYEYFDVFGNYKYNASVNPGIFNSFATAAFRFGHSQIAGHYGVKHNKHIDIRHLFMDTSYVADGLDDVILGLLRGRSQKADTHISEGLTDHLFENTATPGKSLDLVALNIQRGRDHGLPPYIDFLVKWTEDINNHDSIIERPGAPLCSLGLYDSFNDVDLFLGGMDEPHLKDAMVGPTFGYILAKQFYNLRVGDRFWYETKNRTLGFSDDQLAEIRKVSLARVMCENSGLRRIQVDVFKLPRRKGNRMTACRRLPQINLSKWKE
ncbi:peroxidasin homolog [Haliotis rufescens]|uniref:peroxidasin homolog n=1 Tax=Haliotis rufescens TaxID=6454 RepID=UPI001EAF9D89|nr:peroxidasin homolog [Haliotis rufescens]